MTEDQFIRWIQYHCDETFPEDDMCAYMIAFDLDSNNRVSLNEFLSVYVLVQTMERKTLKKRDLYKWSKANFEAIDIDGSGYLDFDEVVYWIEFAVRAGYVSNKNEKNDTLWSSEELADLTIRKYDDNF